MAAELAAEVRTDDESRGAAELMTMVDCPLLRTTQNTATDYWNDSCSIEELVYAIERGATGATSNPGIVFEVMMKEKAYWFPRVHELAAANPAWTELDLTWAVVEEMAVRGASILRPVFDREGGRKGRLSIQTNPTNHPNVERMVEQGVYLAGLAPNIQVKFPVTAAGVTAIEEATARGAVITGTVVFTVAQALAVAEAVERGLKRREQAGEDVLSMKPVCAIMIGRLDDWMRVLVELDNIVIDPTAVNWAGIAVFKRAYSIYREHGYRTRLLAAAYRHRLHWTELVGGDVILTITHQWQTRFNASGIEPVARIDDPVDGAIIAELLERIPDFRRAYEAEGLTPAEFDTYGATRNTLRSFIKSYYDLMGAVRDLILPDPSVRVSGDYASAAPLPVSPRRSL